MAQGRRYYRTNRRSRRRAYSSYSRSKRRAVGNYKAALQQKDLTNVNISCSTKCSCFTGSVTINTSGGSNKYNNGVYALNIWDLLRRSDFYKSYANMYDQIKINSIRIKLTPMAFATLGEDNSVASNMYYGYTVVTAWDRTGLNDKQCELKYSRNSEIVGTPNDDEGFYVTLNGSDISTYSSAVTKSMSVNSNTSIVRYMYPSNIQEKSFYVNTSDLVQWYENYDKMKNRFYGFPAPSLVQGRSTIDYNGDETSPIQVSPLAVVNGYPQNMINPCYLVESPTIQWKPTLLIGLLNDEIYTTGSNNQDIQIQPRATFNLEADIGVTFRGLRKSEIIA